MSTPSDYEAAKANYPTELEAFNAKVAMLNNDLMRVKDVLVDYMEEVDDDVPEPGTLRKYKADIKCAKDKLAFEEEFGRPKEPVLVDDNIEIFQQDLEDVLEAGAFHVENMHDGIRFSCAILVNAVNNSEFSTHHFYLREGTHSNRARKLQALAKKAQAKVDSKKVQQRTVPVAAPAASLAAAPTAAPLPVAVAVAAVDTSNDPPPRQRRRIQLQEPTLFGSHRGGQENRAVAVDTSNPSDPPPRRPRRRIQLQEPTLFGSHRGGQENRAVVLQEPNLYGSGEENQNLRTPDKRPRLTAPDPSPGSTTGTVNHIAGGATGTVHYNYYSTNSPNPFATPPFQRPPVFHGQHQYHGNFGNYGPAGYDGQQGNAHGPAGYYGHGGGQQGNVQRGGQQGDAYYNRGNGGNSGNMGNNNQGFGPGYWGGYY